jgi:hypothetical protein
MKYLKNNYINEKEQITYLSVKNILINYNIKKHQFIQIFGNKDI